MELNHYFEQAISTAIYPAEASQEYPTLGLVNEAWELKTSLNQHCRLDAVKGEVGDVLWYVALCCRDYGISMNNLFYMETFEDIARERKCYLGAAIEIAALRKKAIRDESSTITSARLHRIRQCLADVLIALTDVCKRAGFTLEDAAEYNNLKLASRAARGVLQGDGDNR